MTFKSGDALSPLSAPLVDRDLTDTQCIPRRWPESEQLQFSLFSRAFLPHKCEGSRSCERAATQI